MKSRNWIVVSSVIAGSLVAYAFLTLDAGPPERRFTQEPPRVDSPPAAVDAAPWEDDPSTELPSREHWAQRIDTHHPAEAPESRDWDERSSRERIAREVRVYRKALLGITTGDDVDRNIARAENTLTVLRAELYGSEHGRRKHEELEGELDSAVAQLGEDLAR